VKRKGVNLGVAVDLIKKDGTRTLLVPNIKNANALSFSEFLTAYDDVITRAREGKLQISDFQGTTVSLTNPGTIGTVASIPRLMEGQSVSSPRARSSIRPSTRRWRPEAFSQLGISKLSRSAAHTIIASFRARVGRVSRARARVSDRQARFYKNIF
jgi:2-oxoglutarate dehydrogenase E1 component